MKWLEGSVGKYEAGFSRAIKLIQLPQVVSGM